MSETKLWYLVTYDVRDPKRLRKVAKRLEGYGQRLQLSVFRCWLGNRERERLTFELKRLMEPEDGLLIAGLCARCTGRLIKVNPKLNWPQNPLTFEII